MRAELDNYITNHYYELLAIAKKYTKNDDWADELLHEVILQLYDKKEWKIILDEKNIKYYIIRCIMVNWTYPSSPFYRKIKKPTMEHIDIQEANHITATETDQISHQIMEIIETEYSEIDWFNKLLFEKYMVLGSYRKVSKDTNLSIGAVHNYINQTKNTIKLNTFKKLNNE